MSAVEVWPQKHQLSHYDFTDALTQIKDDQAEYLFS